MDLRLWIPQALGKSRRTVQFATWRISSWQSPLEPEERADVARVLHQRKHQGAELLAFVVMDDHVHVLARAEAGDFRRLLETWKAHTAMQLRDRHNRGGAIWRRDTSVHEVGNQDELRKRADYIAGNPWKRWPFTERYPWVWESAGTDADVSEEAGGLAASLANLVYSVARTR